MFRRTKIVCTIGPSVNEYEKIIELIDAGMNVARLNFSHGTHEEHAKVIANLKKAREEKGVALALMLDTKGPEIRVGELSENVIVEEGMKLKLGKGGLPINPSHVVEDFAVGSTILFDDGYITSKVVEKGKDHVIVEILNPGVIKSRKGINAPDSDVSLPAMTEKDVQDITFGCRQGVDLIAASFIRSASHILEIKELLVKEGGSDIAVLAKIENHLGVENFDDIIQVADGIMVARGDLGVELPLKMVPNLQKMMIKKCYHAAKPVVTATQMLESMMNNPRPTRAEVSDVANAIFDSTSAVMLSGETAVGRYPIETVRMMRSIVEESEQQFPYEDFLHTDAHNLGSDVSSSVALATVKTAYSTGAKAIFAYSNSGFIARMFSRFRPKIPILTLTGKEKVFHQLALSWGVVPVGHQKGITNVQEAFSIMSQFAMKRGIVQYGDLVVVTSGAPFGVSGTTNMMMVENIGDVLVRGNPGEGKTIHGQVAIILSPKDAKAAPPIGKILLLSRCTPAYQPFFKHALGIILQHHPDDRKSSKLAFEYARKYDLPIITCAHSAMSFLQEDQMVTLNPKKGLVYKGTLGSETEMLGEIDGL